MDEECCGNCRYWSEGWCRRYPPTVVLMGDDLIACGIAIGSGEWCGEWRKDEAGSGRDNRDDTEEVSGD